MDTGLACHGEGGDNSHGLCQVTCTCNLVPAIRGEGRRDNPHVSTPTLSASISLFFAYCRSKCLSGVSYIYKGHSQKWNNFEAQAYADHLPLAFINALC